MQVAALGARSFAQEKKVRDTQLELGAGIRQNRLLSALAPDIVSRWLPELEPVELELGDALYESDTPTDHVFFPTTAIVSLLQVLQDGASTEIAIVGGEGMVGVSQFMGGNRTPSRAVVQIAGLGIRMNASFLKGEFKRSIEVRDLLLRYTQALIAQMTQTAVCNRHHSVNQQLCRWLLLTLDRMAGSKLSMTQELIASMLGVRREGVTLAASSLQRAGLIEYQRGQIAVLDRPGLERCTCECYAVVKKEYDRLLPVRGRPQATLTGRGALFDHLVAGRR
jgi:CRP-like cAMP-binding protein